MGAFGGWPTWLKVIYCAKQLIGGLISPTEWFELAFFAYSRGRSRFGFDNKVAAWWWNYGDNIIFTVFKDDTTWGMFKAIAAAVQGDWSHFTFWADIFKLANNPLGYISDALLFTLPLFFPL